jgi:hypothetical protein
MSVPAAPRGSRATQSRRRAPCCPIERSVIVTPVNPMDWRSSVTPIAWDQPAALALS